MSHTYISSFNHSVFSTKHREPLISKELQPTLWAYMGGIARKNGFKALEVGGIENHAHLLLSLPGTIDLSKAMQLIKGGSSKWMNVQQKDRFAWQEGYSAFSVGISQLDRTIRYFQNQEQHHKKISFEDEYIQFLKKHGIEYDPRYVFG